VKGCKVALQYPSSYPHADSYLVEIKLRENERALLAGTVMVFNVTDIPTILHPP
jgi:hypothetical protein